MKQSFAALLGVLLFALPAGAFAAPEDSFEVSGWVPYWSGLKGPRDAVKHIDSLTALMPFAYSVKKDGALQDLAGMKKSAWKRLVKEAKDEEVRLTPTVMWSDTAAIYSVLSNESLRKKHVKEIVELVEKQKYDGIDIDYEGKTVATRPYFSLFLKELDTALGSKFLSCTIEARTPPDSAYRAVPATLEYANDLKEINKYCDRVNLMTYDQQRADLKLNDARKGYPYYPVADPDWVRKVVNLVSKDIDKKKLTIGVATYGRELEITVSPQWFQNYKQLWSVTHDYAEDTAKDERVRAGTNAAGEQSFTYIAKGAPVKESKLPKAPAGTPRGMEIAARALAYANETGKTLSFNIVWWSDADAIEEKVDLARELGVRGVAIFKIDGTEDDDLWKLF